MLATWPVRTRQRRNTWRQACRRRKKVEMLFAHLKRILRLTRLRLRGERDCKQATISIELIRELGKSNPDRFLDF
jgi:hypothetical protein